MIITINPMPALIADAEAQVNEHYNRLAAMSAQQDQEHAIKRVLAQQVGAGQPASPEFAAAAAIEGVSIDALAATVVAKPDDVLIRANARRALVLKMRAAQIPADLTAALIGVARQVAGNLPPPAI